MGAKRPGSIVRPRGKQVSSPWRAGALPHGDRAGARRRIERLFDLCRGGVIVWSGYGVAMERLWSGSVRGNANRSIDEHATKGSPRE